MSKLTEQQCKQIDAARAANLCIAIILQRLAKKELNPTQAFIKIASQVKLASRAFGLLKS
jgi:hypothetical protein